MELFKNTESAILFALRFSSQQYAMFPMAKMLKSGGGSGKGLVALDGAGQAGMIRARIELLNPLQRACIIARYSQRVQACPCCGGDTPLDEYKQAILTLATWAEQYISSKASVQRLRYGIVQDYFERRRSVRKLAESIGVPARTAYDQKDKIWPPLANLDKAAQEHIGDLLHDLCGELAE